MKILIVEDQTELLNFLKESLEAECFVVDGVTDGKEGSHLACTRDYDFIILDNHLPQKTGMEICKEIRSLHKRVPILILSVQNDTPKKLNF